MPRQARKKSESGIYHVMLRGINQQQIFEDEEDCEKFIQVLKDCKAISKFKLYAYCLMDNHIHLLIQEEAEPIDKVLKRITTRYVYWYNIKYQRIGHLFQDRFKSEPVDNDEYFLTVIRYIHQNPIKAGICNKSDKYQYSSYKDYLSGSGIVDTEFVFGIIAKEDFESFHKKITNEKCLDIEEVTKIKVTDEQAKRIIEKYSKCKSVSDFQSLETKDRDKYLKIFKEKGISIRQISRLTGVSYYLVQKA